MSPEERRKREALQKQIIAAVQSSKGLTDLPTDIRRQADTPWFQSVLNFSPARVLKDVRQPLLILHAGLDHEVEPADADRLAQIAQKESDSPSVELLIVKGVNHLIVPAVTGEVEGYGALTDRNVSADVVSANNSLADADVRRNQMTPPRTAIVGTGRVAQAFGRLLADAGIAARCGRRSNNRPCAPRRGVHRARRQGRCSSATFQRLRPRSHRCRRRRHHGGGGGAGGKRDARRRCTPPPAHSPQSLSALAARGVACGVVHPLQTIADPDRGISALRGASFGISGDAAAVEWAGQLVTAAGGNATPDPRERICVLPRRCRDGQQCGYRSRRCRRGFVCRGGY